MKTILSGTLIALVLTLGVGCGSDDDGGGGTTGKSLTCPGGKAAKKVAVSCQVDDTCVEYRSDFADLARKACEASQSGKAVSRCPVDPDRFGTCLWGCGTGMEFSADLSPANNVATAEEAKDACEAVFLGVWSPRDGGAS